MPTLQDSRLWLIAALLALLPITAAADDISGTITSDTTWTNDAPIVISGEVTVPEDVTLTVEPGAEVRFDGDYRLTINGALQASGGESDRITFTSNQDNPSPGAWQGIRFGSTVGFPESALDYVDIRYAETAVRIENVSSVFTLEFAHLDIRDVSSRGMLIVDSKVELDELTIRDFGEEGVRITGSDADVTITAADIQQQRSSRVLTGAGLYAREGATVEMSDSKIRLTESGVVAYRSGSTPSVELQQNTIKENRRGVFVDPRDGGRTYPQITANNNDIYDNVDWNVRLNAGNNPSTTAFDFTDNWWGTADGVEIAAAIFDASNSSSRAFVDYLPFLNDSFENDGVSTSENYLSNWVTEPTTWTADGGPYVVTGRVLVRGDDAELMIEAGTEVKFVEHGIEVEPTGVLQIAGSEADPVQLTSYDQNPEPGAWSGIQMRESTASSYLRYAHIEYATTALELRDIEGATEGSPEVANLDIRDVGSRGVMVMDSKVELEALTIRDFGEEGIRVTGTDADVNVTAADIEQERSSRIYVGDGLHVSEGATVELSESTIRLAESGVVAYRSSSTPSVELQNNTIKENRRGVFVDPRDSGRAYPEITANNNDIYDNVDWNVLLSAGNNPSTTALDFTDNWWGSGDGVEIASTIYDASNSSSRAFVNYLPFLNDSFENDGVSTSENYLSNWITKPTTWTAEGGPYVVTGRVIVRGDEAELTIEAGTEVQFVEHGIEVEPTGVLQIAGTEAELVKLTSYALDPDPGAWAGIKMRESTASSHLHHARIDYAATALELRDIEGATEGSPDISSLRIIKAENSGIRVINGRLEVSQVEVIDFRNIGVLVTGSDSRFKITNSEIKQESSSYIHIGTGIDIKDGPIVELNNSIIYGSRVGLRVYRSRSCGGSRSKSVINLLNSIIKENRTGIFINPGYTRCGRTGVYRYAKYPDAVSHGSFVLNNVDWNIDMTRGSNPEKEFDFTTNWWGVADSTGIADKIYDNSNSSNRATVLFEPFSLTEDGLLSPDINADGTVDGDDLVILGAAFGSDPSKDHWNPLADLTIQGRVNGFDLSVLAAQFGEDVSPQAFVAEATDADPLTAFSTSGTEITTALVLDREGIAVDDTFRVRLQTEDIPDLFGVTANLKVDTSFVEVLDVEEGAMLSEAGEQRTTFLHRVHEDGRVMTGLTRMEATSTGVTVDEAGPVWTVILRARAAGETAIEVDRSRFTASDIQTTYPHELEALSLNIADGRVLKDDDEGPTAFLLESNYPNPFRDRTAIAFELPDREHVRLAVYDLLGREVTVLADDVFAAGRHEAVWDITTTASDLASGVYMYRLQAGEHVESKRMVLIR